MHHQRFITNVTGKGSTRFLDRELKIEWSQVTFRLFLEAE